MKRLLNKEAFIKLILRNHTRVLVFICGIVILVPFAIAFGLQNTLIELLGENWWVVPLIVATILATCGSIIFLFAQRKAEDKVIAEQRKYQDTLRQASLGMGQIRDLNKLLKLIVHMVTRTVKIKQCLAYLYHESSKQYVLKASRGILWDITMVNSTISSDSALVESLRSNKDPIFLSDFKSDSEAYNRKEIIETRSMFNGISKALVLPCFIEDKLIAIFVLGEKRSGDTYSYEDMSMFSILANQSALAIENAQFYEDMKKTHEQLFKADKMATIGTMADGLSHQINNRLHAIGFISGDAIDSIKIRQKKEISETQKEVLETLRHSLERIEDNVKRGGEIVEGLLKYTRKGDEGLEPLELNKILDSAIEMVQFKIKLREIIITRNFDEKIPKVLGNFTQLQEVFFNIIDNSYDAMMQRKNELAEAGYKAKIEIFANKKGKNLEIIFRDNGMGVKKEDFNRLFQPFFTTKIENRKGTGLGLYVIKQLIEENHKGKIEFISEHKIGSQTRILLPVAM